MRSKRKQKTKARPSSTEGTAKKRRAANRTRTKRRSGPATPRSHVVNPQWLFPKLESIASDNGQGAFIAFTTREKTGIQIRYARFEAPNRTRPARKNSHTPTTRDPAGMARLLHGLAHVDRIRVADALYRGARTHQSLKESVGLQAGPLYHHLRELERGGLVESFSRNDYQLTEAGRLALLLTSGLHVLLSNSRRTAPWQTRRKAAKAVKARG
ncbi:MAG: winged helix-turn-helix domain-containing protein [Phycisphaerales bacterium]|nr:winged helix-turn-helix domain-containing protein [Phycisphaerales bacterium]